MKKQVKSAKTKASQKPTQSDWPANFADASFDYPRKSFEQVARFLLRPNPFPKTKNGAYFRKVCKEVFDREREKRPSLTFTLAQERFQRQVALKRFKYVILIPHHSQQMAVRAGNDLHALLIPLLNGAILVVAVLGFGRFALWLLRLSSLQWYWHVAFVALFGQATVNFLVGGIAQGLNVVKVSVADVRVEHAVKLLDFTNWLEKAGGSPRETSDRRRIRAILGMPVSR